MAFGRRSNFDDNDTWSKIIIMFKVNKHTNV
jgi:hypothetical protein